MADIMPFLFTAMPPRSAQHTWPWSLSESSLGAATSIYSHAVHLGNRWPHVTIKIEINLKILRIQFHNYTSLSQVLISCMRLVDAILESRN